MASMGDKELPLSSLAKEVYLQHVGGGTVPANMLPLIERSAPKFPSQWAKQCCTSMTLSLHWGIMGALFKKIRIVDDNHRPLEQFTVVDVFAGTEGREHIWNMVKFVGDEIWYSVDLSIEQYEAHQVTDTAQKPWNLIPVVEDRYPLKYLKESGAKVADVTATHPLLPKVRCDVNDGATFGSHWKGALQVVKTGFEFKETTAEGEEVTVPVPPQLVQAVTSQVSAVLKRLGDMC
jgi:hypothetical protein